MKFFKFSQYLKNLEKTASRNEMTIILAKLFEEAGNEEIDKICYLSLGRLLPKFSGVEFMLAEKMMIKIIAYAFRVEEKIIRQEFKTIGDLGEVVAVVGAEDGQTPSIKPSVLQVYDRLMMVAKESGEGSVERKIEKMAKLLKMLDPLSAKYLVRVPIGKLRLGFSDVTILDSLSWMEKGDKSLRGELERAYNVSADIGKIAKIFKKEGVDGLKQVKPVQGTPIRTAQAERLPSAEKIIEKLGRCATEFKLDGFRCQIHKDKQKINIFSRNLEDTTDMFPEIVEAAKKLNAKRAILDGEAIGFNPETGKFLPFQETVQRKRKHEVSKYASKIPLKVFLFDCLYFEGKSLLDKPFFERRRFLEKVISEKSKTLKLVPQKIITTANELKNYFQESIKEGLEGLVAKKLDSVYQAGARNFNWVKYKKTTEEGELADTIDCVVMGYYQGRGKRAGFGIGAFLTGILDQKRNLFLTIAKIGTGLSDEQWVEMRIKCEKFKTKEAPKEYLVDKNLFPDGWINPQIVVEIRADEITRSPIHTAGRVMGPSKSGSALEVKIPGFALRFPRLVDFRDDKSPQDVTTLKEIEKMFKMQRGLKTK